MFSEVWYCLAKRTLQLSMFLLFLSQPCRADVSITQSIAPDTIGPGSTTTLSFAISSTETMPVSDLAFTLYLHAATTLAAPALAGNSCNGILTAADGGSTIALTGGYLSAQSSCTISVDIVSNLPGIHTHSVSPWTSSAGTWEANTADLTVDIGRPGFMKSFYPATISSGGRSTLTFTIDNSLNPNPVYNLLFSDTLPAGMVVADPPNATTTCGGTILAATGTKLISLEPLNTISSVAGGSSCTVTIDVTASGNGTLSNSSGSLSTYLSGTPLTSGKANAALTVTRDALHLQKSFVDDPIPAGSQGMLRYTISNYDRENAATAITFTDNLDAALAGLTVSDLPQSDVCGNGSLLSGSGILTLSGASLDPRASCSFSVPISVPGDAASGRYAGTTSTVTGQLNGNSVIGSAAVDTLFVQPVPLLIKEFSDDPVAAPGQATLRFTVTNTSTVSPATAITFRDNLGAIIIPTGTLPTDPCGGGSWLQSIDQPGDIMLTLESGNLAAGESCSFEVLLDIPEGLPSGGIVNTTSEITATIDEVNYAGRPATDTLVILGGAPNLAKSFTNDPVMPGGTVNLQFTLTNTSEDSTATGISFTDDLETVLTGLRTTGLPRSGICGSGSLLSGSDILGLSGGALAPGASCTFNVTLQVPGNVLPGNFYNTTSSLSAIVGGVSVTGPPATDTLTVSSLSFSKSFTNDPVIAGETVDLEFTISNSHPTDSISNLSFSDFLPSVLSGLNSTSGIQNDICGAGSTLSGTSTLFFSGGSLEAGNSCTFTTDLQVPQGTPSGSYLNATSSLLANGLNTGIQATDILVVNNSLLKLTKSFTDAPVAPGEDATLVYTLTNLHPSAQASAISFSDNFDNALTGLTAVNLPADGFCGPVSTLSGGGLVTMAGGVLDGGSSCSFSITLRPPAQQTGAAAISTTSGLSGIINSLPVVGDPASDTLLITNIGFNKSFTSFSTAGGTARLTFNLRNNDLESRVSELSFIDDLSSMSPGVVADGLPLLNVCGNGSRLSGSDRITLNNASLGPNGSCSFSVLLRMPRHTPEGELINTTEPLLLNGLEITAPATAALLIDNDLDNDRLPDLWERDNGLDPTNPGDAALDYDGDGFSNYQEYLYRTHPRRYDADDNNNGLPDSYDRMKAALVPMHYLLNHSQ